MDDLGCAGFGAVVVETVSNIAAHAAVAVGCFAALFGLFFVQVFHPYIIIAR